MDDHLEETIRVNTAIARLADFADTYPDGEQIDGDMELTVDDVRLVIEAAKRGANVVEITGIGRTELVPDDIGRSDTE
ncbi:hypothetical protein ASE90_01640 [Sphingomonas sp. Leaf67]|uniref:hypothetical protein n=1 Tax=Sphingomonas sp. Leaf67 TaxID=1736230 RepID=UPI0006FA0664|nr:hypothetical protein [Sphingomonas sp. Leaf67]KQN91535.1 hypothetical protein ASE90_01640 [Sphingomonas sp. Leaf67]